MIVTGCMRSGTMTASVTFGLPHEKVFVPEITFDSIAAEPPQKEWGEVSWMAQPFTEFLVTRGFKIIHLVRHPYHVVRSLLGIRFFSTECAKGHEPYQKFMMKYLPALCNIKTDVEQAVYYYLWWNRPLEKYPRIRIEDITNAGTSNERRRINNVEEKIDTIPKAMKENLRDCMAEYGYEV